MNTNEHVKKSKTEKRFREDAYEKECTATILAVVSDPTEIRTHGGAEIPGSVLLVLDRTIFFPEGGGQPCDLGMLADPASGDCLAEIRSVFEEDGIVYHQAVLPDSVVFAEGRNVLCRIDWERRFAHMQRHCGEHILSAVFYDLYGGVNRGFHMGESYMTIDINLEERPEYTELTDGQMLAAELAANRMVYENLPVSIRHFDHREDAEGLPMRKTLAIEEDVTLVCVGDESKAAGCVACCGTHPRMTGEVGLIKLYKWENYKGMLRITFDAGENALRRFQTGEEILKALCRRYSADHDTLPERIAAAEQKNKEAKQELYLLKKTYLEEQATEIIESLPGSDEPLLREYPILSADDLVALGRLLPKGLRRLVLLLSPSENTLFLFSNGTPNCGKIVKDNAGVWNGKGGGREDNARAIFPSRQDLDCFADYLFKARKGM